MAYTTTSRSLIFHGPTSPPPGSHSAQSNLNVAGFIYFFWLVYLAYWIVSAIGVKKNISHTEDRRKDLGVRILITISALVVIDLLGSLLGNYRGVFSFGPGIQVFGIFLCAAGIGFAIWARRHLGTNWSGFPTMKEGHELVTSGPYRFVRHPIYTGILAALLGSVLANGLGWAIVFVVAFAVFAWRVKVEERFMMKLFPGTYPAYKKTTYTLIPFIW